MSDAFVDSIGADSHFSYENTPYATKFDVIAPQLVASGIRHLRDADRGTVYAGRMNYLFAHGVKHSIGYNVGDTSASIISTFQTWIKQADFIEPANEWDATSSKNPGWAAQLRALQRLIYSVVRAQPAGKTIPILGPSIANGSLYAAVGDLDSYATAGNLHNATCDYNPGVDNFSGIADQLASASVVTPGKPIWTTETGYNNNMVRPCSLPNDVIAKYDPRTVAERWNAGIPHTYFYQLVDMPVDPIFGGMGLMDAMGRPKPQFTALKSLISLLADPGPAFKPTPLSYIATGETDNIDHTLLQRRDGTYELLFWLEVPSWDHNRRFEYSVPQQTVTVTLPFQLSATRLFTYDRATWGMSEHVFSFCAPGMRCARNGGPLSTALGAATFSASVGSSITLSATDTISVLLFK
jgi:hypothetical protein